MDAVPTETLGQELALFVFAIIFATAGILVFGILIIKSAKYPGLAPLIAPLSIVSALALILGTVSDQAALITIAATGVGALAAVLTKTFGAEEVKTVVNEEIDRFDDYDDEDEDIPSR